MDTLRPNPDALLAAVQKEEPRQQRGKLKIFFGMAAGVGKTHAMLETARERKAEGIDVVVGYVEIHGRPETEALLAGIEIIPRRKVEYRGTQLEEMDTDAILDRHPQLVLVDELAHTNAPGSRHRKRHQDILELLDAGMDVYTTVNVQHFESRADAVRQITGITVHETVPDSLLDLVNEIELIDLAPDDLRKRLAEGKVYTAERAEVAANNFFRVGNLTALREMALRLTAEHVDHKLQDYMQVKHIAGPWKSSERLMVAVGATPFSEQLIRWTRRMAYNLEAPWLAVHVETRQPLTRVQKENLTQNFALVRKLGGEVIITTGASVADALIRLARQRNVTQVVVGKPMHQPVRNLLRGGSLVDYLIRKSGNIDIYVVTGDEVPRAPRFTLWQPAPHSGWRQYVLAVIIVAAITTLNLLSVPWFSYQAMGLSELLAVQLIAVYLGRGPAVVAATVSALSWNFLFIPPHFTFAISQPEDAILFFLYFIVAIFTGNLTARIRGQEQAARHNAERTIALYTLAHETAAAVTMDDVLRTAVTQVSQVFDAEVAILLPRSGKLLAQAHSSSTLAVDEKEFAVASWVFENGKPAGRHTDSLPLATATYLPLIATGHTVGVIGIRMQMEERRSADQEVLLETFTNQIALVIEREMLDEAAEQAAMLRESERLYTTLLNSISHELRTPIATISGASSILLNEPAVSSNGDRSALIHDIQSAAERLNRLVENLLDMSRLDSGRLQLKLEWCDVSDVISVAVKRMEKDLDGHPLTMHLAPNLPLVRMDFVLMEQVLVNLLDNATSYTPADSPIHVSATVEAGSLTICIADGGPGIPPENLERIFDKFYRLPGTATGGTGLGLSICRGLVEAHGGTLTAENAPGGGARFLIRLPVSGSPPPVREAAL